jgi:hypothetical protein
MGTVAPRGLTLATNRQVLPGSTLLGPLMATLPTGVNTLTMWVEVTVPPPFEAITVITLTPSKPQVKLTVSLNPLVCATGYCSVACQT